MLLKAFALDLFLWSVVWYLFPSVWVGGAFCMYILGVLACLVRK
jgi:ABC-type antimicrobial peptide transport system permease subunit